MKNLTINQYATSKERYKYDVLLNSLKSKNTFLGNEIDFNTITYAEVRKMFKIARNGVDSMESMKELFLISYNVTSDEFEQALIVEAFAAKNYIIKFLIETQEKEAKLLKSIGVDSVYWEQAGSAKLDKFSDMMPLVQIGEIYGVYPYDLQFKPYAEILTLLVIHKERNEVQQKYNKLMSKKK